MVEQMEDGLKTIKGFLPVVIAAAFAACATEPPRTLPALPDPLSTQQILQPLVKTSGGDYPGYQLIVANGQQLYCRRSLVKRQETESKVVCFTEAQLRTEHLRALQSKLREARQLENATRPPTPNLDARQAALELQQSAANLPGQYTGTR